MFSTIFEMESFRQKVKGVSIDIILEQKDSGWYLTQYIDGTYSKIGPYREKKDALLEFLK